MQNFYPKQSQTSLPHSVYYADWIRRAEKEGAAYYSITLYDLMERAGEAVFFHSCNLYPTARHWLILCGHGNNGGDGYIVACLAKNAGIRVTVIACSGSNKLPVEATQARKRWLQMGGEIDSADAKWPDDIDLIVDGLLGIGINAAPRAPYSTLIKQANSHSASIVAIDLPSGLMADTGAVLGEVIQAQHTVVLLALKPGVLIGQARNCVGCLHYADIGMESWLQTHPIQLIRCDESNLSNWFTPRSPCAHKGHFGRLLLLGGARGMGGAIRMAAEAALRTGAGLVRVLTHLEHITAILAACPEIMVDTLDDEKLEEALLWADTIVVGPGLGQQEWGKRVVQQVALSEKVSLWDADALNLLAISPQNRQNRVLTPHPGEAARLLGCSTEEVESDRLLAVHKLVEIYGGVVVLKGACTLVAHKGNVVLIDVGNPGMATAGMGDILSGVVGGLLAQKMSLFDAACAGCVVHGSAADSVAERQGERGMLATDLLAVIPQKVNP